MSENNTIFEKIKALNRINEEIKRNIKLIYVFEAYLEQIHIILITNKDEVYCFGCNWNGVLGFGHNNIVEEFTFNEDLSNKQIVELKNSECHTIARTSDGKLLCWGNNWWGCLGNESVDRKTYKPEFNKHLYNETIIDMCCGNRHTLVLTSNKEVYAWGDNQKGQIGNKTNGDVVSIPLKVKEFDRGKVKAISCGFNHSMALTESGCVYSWGYNIWGQLGLNDGESKKVKPQPIQIAAEITKIICGYGHSLLLSNEGDIYVCGWNKYRQLGTYKNKIGPKANEEKQIIPIKLNRSEKFIEIASLYNYNILAALSDRNLYYIWGKCGRDGIISAPKKTKFKSFDEIFLHYLQITYKTLDFADGRYKKEFKPVELLGNERVGKVDRVRHLKGQREYAIKKNYFKGKSQSKMWENNTLFAKLSPHGRYEHEFKEETLLGNGSFGKVYKVLHLKEKQYYAIKKINFNDHCFNITPEKFKDECLNEIRFMQILKEDYVVNYIRSWSEYEDMFYIQMELCETDLNNVLQKLRIEFKRNPNQTTSSIKYYISSELFNETLEALNYLHSQNPPIIHRDLKPNNILITNGVNGRFVKLADIGLAVIHNFKDESHTQDRGTLAYMAPEVKNGRQYDIKSDVYSLGLIALQLFDLSSNIPIDDSLLAEKYGSAQNLVTNMTTGEKNIKNRPNCQQILDSEKSWYFNIEILRNDSIYKNIIESKLDQSMIDCFHKYFIRKKHSKIAREPINVLGEQIRVIGERNQLPRRHIGGVVGVVIGGAIGGPVGALFGGWLGSKFDGL